MGVGRGLPCPVDAVTPIKVYNENIEHGAVTILSQQLDTSCMVSKVIKAKDSGGIGPKPDEKGSR